MSQTDPYLLNRDWEKGVITYPDPAIEVLDARFAKFKIGNSAIERLCTGFRWAEGPVWFGDGGYLLWSDIPNNRIMRWDERTGQTSVYRQPSNNSNGHTRDRVGRLVSCEHDSRRVTRTEYDGTITVLMDNWQGKRLNAPNDVAVHADGSIWFTDPGYGIMMNYEGHKSEFELPRNVYRIDGKSGEATIVLEGFDRPNGLCFSPDFKKLYVVDTGRDAQPAGTKPIHVFDVTDDNKLTNGKLFVDMSPGNSDGIRCDVEGNLWSAAGGADGHRGVHCFASNGDLIGKIHLPENCANLCFGGEKKNRLFMVASQSLYSVYLEALGAQWP